jgi:argininosuccinate lyase
MGFKQGMSKAFHSMGNWFENNHAIEQEIGCMECKATKDASKLLNDAVPHIENAVGDVTTEVRAIAAKLDTIHANVEAEIMKVAANVAQKLHNIRSDVDLDLQNIAKTMEDKFHMVTLDVETKLSAFAKESKDRVEFVLGNIDSDIKKVHSEAQIKMVHLVTESCKDCPLSQR